jgi:PAS domain-containing protein
VNGHWASAAALACLALIWIGIAAWVTLVASRRLRLAQQVLEAARSNARLLELMPARPLLITPDGRVDVDQQLLRDLGLRERPSKLSDLAGEDCGILPEDLQSLSAAVEAARASASRLSLKVRAHGSARIFDVSGRSGPADEPRGSMLLWFVDASAAEEERATLALRLRQSEGALNSLTQLIEAAPFPMWYRGPDLKLGLVNSAFVQAVEAQDAADVINRSAELLDAQGDESPAASARQARDGERIVSRMQPAIIRGERRMLRVVDVPLASGAVAGFAIDVQDLEDARAELGRYIESQRELADRMTAGTAQFDADRTLSFFNRPFAMMSQLDADWLN